MFLLQCYILIRGWEETFGGDGHVYGVDCGDGFMGVYSSSNSYIMYTFLYVKKKKVTDI